VGVSAVAILPVWILVLRERLRNPAVLEYWNRDDEELLTIRRLGTGEALLQAACPDLQGASLVAAQLGYANLQQLNLEGADLRDADLRCADLREAVLRNANLTGADLRGARLDSAQFAGSTLRGADLRGADLVGRGVRHTGWATDLASADLAGARYDAATRWPWGFDPAACGCVYENDAEHVLPIPADGRASTAATLPVAAQAARGEDELLPAQRLEGHR
jgi:hypothetical protein